MPLVGNIRDGNWKLVPVTKTPVAVPSPQDAAGPTGPRLADVDSVPAVQTTKKTAHK
jgi:hypothetical protein